LVAADAPVPVAVVVLAQVLDVLRKRSVYWRHALLRKRSRNASRAERRVVMSNKWNERRIRVRAVRRDPPDLKKLSRALIALAMAQAQAEAEAQAEHEAKPDEQDEPRVA
jgi:hypothetical protein